MRQQSWPLAAVVIPFLAACTSQVERSNPFDPEAPKGLQEKARIEGQAALESAPSAAGVRVVVSEASAAGVAPITYETSAGEGGGWAVEVPPGAYNVALANPGYLPLSVSNVAVGPGEFRFLGRLTLTIARGGGQGQVVLDDGANPAGTAVSLIPLDVPGGQVATVIAGADGTWFAGGLQVGTYAVRAEKESYAPAYTAKSGDFLLDHTGNDADHPDKGLKVGHNKVATAPTLRLYPASAIVQPRVGGVVNARYTNDRAIEIQLLAFVQFLTDMQVSEDTDFDDPAWDTDWRQFAAQAEFQLSDRDGPHRVHARFRDSFGVVSDAFSTSIVLDRAPPEITSFAINGGAAFLTAQDGAGAASLAFTGQDLLSGVDAWRFALGESFSDQPFQRIESVGPSFSLAVQAAVGDADAEKVVVLEVRDRAGNVSAPRLARIRRDKTPPAVGAPAIAVADAMSDGTVRALEVSLSFDVSSDRAGERLYAAVSNAPGLDANAFFLPLVTPWAHRLADGPDAMPRLICAIFRDEAGLLTEQHCLPVRLDRTGSLAGQVLLEDETVHSGTLVELQGLDGASTWREVSGADGRWTLGGAPGGLGYTLRFSRTGWATQVVRDVVVVIGSTVERGTVTLRLPRATVSGAVTLVDKGAGQHGGIVVADEAGGATTVTAPSGAFSLAGLKTNQSWRLVAREPGYASLAFPPVAGLGDGEVREVGGWILQKVAGDFRICADDDDRFCSRGAIAVTASRTVLLDVKSPLPRWRVALERTFDGSSQAFEPFDASTDHRFTFAAAQGDGPKTIWVQFWDGRSDSAPEPPLSGAVFLDTTPPQNVQVRIDGGAAYSNHPSGTVALAVSAEDDGPAPALAACLVRALPPESASDETGTRLAPCASPLAHTLDTAVQGQQSVWVKVCDAAGNCATDWATDSIVYDTVPPGASSGVTLALDGGAQVTSSPVVTLRVTTGDAVALRFGNTESLLGATFLDVDDAATVEFQQILPGGDGEKTVWAQLRDAAGNLSPTSPNPNKAIITLDTLPPTGGTVRIAQGAYTNLAAVDVELTAAGAAEYLLHLGAEEDFASADWLPFTGVAPGYTMSVPASIPGPADGTWTAFARFRDAAGNETRTFQRSIVRDTARPAGALALAGGAYAVRSAANVPVLITAPGDVVSMALVGRAGADCATESIGLDFNPNTSFTFPDPAQDGPLALTVCLADRAGNLASAADTVVLDRAAPAARLTVRGSSNEEVGFTRTELVRLTLEASDAWDGDAATVDALRLSNDDPPAAGAPWEPMVSSRLWSLGAAGGDGTRTVWLEVRDRAGWITRTSAAVALDTRAPTGSIAVASGPFVKARAVTLNVTRGDLGTTRMSISEGFVDCGGADYADFAASTDFTLSSGDGVRTLYLCLRDGARNTGAASTAVTLDTAAPAGALAIAGGAAYAQSRNVSGAVNVFNEVLEATSYRAQAGTVCSQTPADYQSLTPTIPLVLEDTDGVQTVNVCLRDRAGNIALVSDTIHLDRARPALGAPAISIPAGELTPGGAVMDLEVTLLFDVTGDRSGEKMFMTVANASGLDTAAFFVPLQSPYLHRLAYGPDSLARQICAVFKDEAGNTTAETCRAVAVDRSGAVTGRALLEGASTHSGVQVDLDGAGGNTYQTFSDAAGNWTLPGVPGGLGYTLRLSKTGFVAQTVRDVTVVTGATVDRGTVTLRKPRATITSAVTFVDKGAGEHSGIVVSDTSAGASAVTNPNGTFVLSDLLVERTWNLSARFPGYLTHTFAPISDLQPGEVRNLGAFTLQKQQGDFRICAGTDDKFCAGGAIAYTGSRIVLLDIRSNLTQWRTSLDATFGGGSQPFEPFDASTEHRFTFGAGATDGSKQIFVQLKDAANPPEPAISGVVTLDTTPPAPGSPAVAIDAGALYSKHPTGQVTLTLSASDQLSGVSAVRIANGAPDFTGIAKRGFATSLTHALDVAGQGAKTVYVQFCDLVDNCTPDAGSDAIVYDTVPPGGATGASITLNNGAPLTNSPLVVVTLTTGDAVAVRVGNTQALLGADFRDAGTNQTVDLAHAVSLAEGLKTVYAQFRDAAGNLSPTEPNPHFDTITLDLAPPTGGRIDILSGPFTNQDGASVRISAEAVEYLLHVGKSEDFIAETWKPFTGAPPDWEMDLFAAFPAPAVDGTYNVYVRFRDGAGNVTSTYSQSVTRDTIVPLLPRVEILEGDYTRFQAVNISLFAAGASTMIIAADGVIDTEQPQLYAPAATVTLLPAGQGPRTVRVRFYDEASNASDTVSDSTTVDSVAPSAVTFAILEAPYTRGAQVTLDIAATAAAQMKVANNSTFAGASWEPFAQARAWTLPPIDGSKTVYLLLADEAGNETATFQAATLLDATPPGSLSVDVAGGAAYVGAGAVTVNLSAADANGVSDIQLANDALFSGASWEPYTTARPGWDLETGDGPKTVYVRFRDRAGNTAQKADTVIVDSAAPAGTVSIAAGAVAVQSPVGVALSLSASADVTHMKLLGSAGADCAAEVIDVSYNPNATYTWTGSPPDGALALTVCFKDAAGLRGQASDTVLLDRDGPSASLTINGGSGLWTRSPVVTLAISAADTQSGVDATRVANAQDMSGVAWEPYVGSKIWTVGSPASDGTKTVWLEARDKAGLVTANVSATVNLDTQSPTGSLSVVGGAFSRSATVALTVTRGDTNTTEMAVAQGFLDCAGASYGDFAASTDLTLAGGDGLKTVGLCLRDLAGNTAGYSTSVSVDTVTPSGTLAINGGAAYSQSRTVTLNVTTDADVVSMRAADGSTTDCATGVYTGFNAATSYSLPDSDGTDLVAVCVRDASGRAAMLTDGIVLDRSVPEPAAIGARTGISINSNAAQTNSTQVTFSLAATDQTSGVAGMKISDGAGCAGGAWTDYTTTAVWILEPGDNVSRTVSVSFRDAAGNVSTTCAVDDIMIDTVNATVTVFSLDGGGVNPDYADGATIGIANLAYVGNCANIQVSEDASFSAAVRSYACNQTWPATYVLADSGTDGLKYVYARIKDDAGNYSAAAVDTVILDTGGPTNAGVVIDGGATYSSDLTLTVTYIALGAIEMKVTMNETCTGGTWETLKSAEIKVHPGQDADGKLWVSAEFRDAASNGVGVCNKSSVRYDPDWTGGGSIIIVPLAGTAPYTTSTEVNLTLVSGEGAGAEMKLSNGAGCIGGAWEPFASTKSWSLASGGEGTRTVSVVYRDPAGNQSSCYADDADIDTVPPSGLSVLIDAGADYTTDAGSQVTLTIGGTGHSQVKVSEDPNFAGTSWIAPTAVNPFQLSGINGTKTVYVKFRDAAGNEAPSLASDNIILDNQAPSGTLEIDAGATYSTSSAGYVTLSLNASDNLSGVTSMQFSTADAATTWGAWQTAVPYAPTYGPLQLALPVASVNGSERLVRVRFTDRAGNISATAVESIVLDNVNPSAGAAAISIENEATFAKTQTVSLNLSATLVSEMKLSNGQACSGGSWETYASSRTWTLDGVGDDVLKYVSVRYRDDAGNTTACFENSIRVDSQAPVAQFVIIENGASHSRLDSLLLTIAYSGTATARYVVVTPAGSLTSKAAIDAAVAAAAPQDASSTPATASAAGKQEGPLEIYVQLADEAGNRSNAVVDTIVRDTAAPQRVSLFIDGNALWATDPTARVALTLNAADPSGVEDMRIANRVGGADADVQILEHSQTYLDWQLAAPFTADAETRTVVARFVDVAGNWSVETTDSVVLDNVPPQSPTLQIVALDDNPTRTKGSLVKLNLSATGANLGGPYTMQIANATSCAAGGSLFFYNTQQFWELGVTGDQGTLSVVAVKFFDRAGNASLCVTDDIGVDTVAPILTSVSVDGSYNQSGVKEGTDPTATRDCYVRLSSAAVTGVYDRLQFSLDHTFQTIFQDVAPSAIPTNLLQIPGPDCATEGAKTLYVRARDLTGNVSTALAYPMRVDKTAPTFGPNAIVLDAGEPFTNDPTFTLTLNGFDTGSGIALAHVRDASSAVCTSPTLTVAWDGADTSTEYPWSPGDADGVKTLWLCLEDGAGNRTASPFAFDSIFLDRAKPTIGSFTINSGATYTTTSAVNLTSTASDNAQIAGAYVSNQPDFGDASLRPYVSGVYLPWELDLPSLQGAKSVFLRVVDRAGNFSDATDTILLDSIPPSNPTVILVENDARPNNRFTNETLVTARINASGAPRTAFLSESTAFGDGTSEVDLTGKTLPLDVPFSLGGTGLRTVWVRFRDAAGNLSNQAPGSVTVDTTAPFAAVATLSPRDYTRLAGIQLIPPSAGQDELQITGDVTSPTGFVIASAGVPINVTLSAGNAVKTLAVTYRDLAENTVSAPALTITLDGAPPVVANFAVRGKLGDGATDTALTSTAAVTLDFSGQTDLLSGIKEVKISNTGSLADAGWQGFVASGAVPWALSQGDGPKTVYASFRDHAGNEAGPVQGTIELRATPPSGGAVVIENGALHAKDQIADLSISAVGAAQMAVSADGFAGGTTWINYATTATVDLGQGEGLKIVSVKFRNMARAEGGSASSSIVYDKSAPAAGQVFLHGTLGNGNESTDYTTTPSVVVYVLGPIGDFPADMALAQSSSCATAFATPSWQPFSPTTTFVLSGANGSKQVCIILRDDAGNFSAANNGAATIALDTLAPSNPAFTNIASGYSNASTAPSAGSAVVTSSSDNLGGTVTFQCFGGQYGELWSDCGTSTTMSAFTLIANTTNTLGVRARDVAYNYSAGSLVSIIHDNIAPTAGSTAFKLTGELGNSTASNSLTTNAAIVASVTSQPADAAEMALVQSGDCQNAFSASSPWQAIATAATFVLSGGDGAKQVCLLFRDAALNFAGANFLASSITLDRTAPSNPSFTNLRSTVTSQPTVSGSVTALASDPSGAFYQCFGGREYTDWADCSGSPPFNFTLALNAENNIGVRARDGAYNYSSGSLVTIVHDDTPPAPPVITELTTSSEIISLVWGASTSADVAEYRVNYGLAPGNTGGVGASQGPSPLRAGEVTSFQITGLTTGQPYYVSVVAVDGAGNQSVPSIERVAMPNVVNPRLLATMGSKIASLGISGTRAYLGEHQSITQLDISSNSGVPPVLGRATLPNFAVSQIGASSFPVVACTYKTKSGECAYVAGLAMTNSTVAPRVDVTVVFFPDGDADRALRGPIGTLYQDRALSVHLAGTHLVTVNLDGIRVYSLADPTRPVAVRKALFPSPFTNAQTDIYSAGAVGNAFYVFQGAPYASGSTDYGRLWGVPDVTQSSISFTNYGFLLDAPAGTRVLGPENGVFTPKAATVFGPGGLYLVRNCVAGGCGSALDAMSYAPATSLAPQSTKTGGSSINALANMPLPTAAAGNHIYVFDNFGPPQGHRFTVSGLTFTADAVASVPQTTRKAAIAAAAAVSGGTERLLVADQEELHRWYDSGTGLNEITSHFLELPGIPTAMATSGQYVFMARYSDYSANQPAAIFTVDVSVPNAPRVIRKYVRPGPIDTFYQTAYKKLVVRGGYLYAAVTDPDDAGVDIFTIGVEPHKGDPAGELTRKTIAYPGGGLHRNAWDIALSGNYLYVARGSDVSCNINSECQTGQTCVPVPSVPGSPGYCGVAGLHIFDVTDPEFSGGKDKLSSGTQNIKAVDARGQSVYTLGKFGYQTLTYDGTNLTTASSIVTGIPHTDYLSVSGPYAFASGFSGTTKIDVTYPGSPSYSNTTPNFFPVNGRPLFQSGYLVGAPFRFVNFDTGAVEGSIPYGACSQVTGFAGIYLAACYYSGVQVYSALDPGAGVLHQRADISNTWYSGAFATDGARLFFAGPYQPDFRDVWTGLTKDAPTGSLALSAIAPSPLPQSELDYMSLHEGTLFGWLNFGVTFTGLKSYDATVDGSLTLKSSLSMDDPVGQPIDDGRYVYVPADTKLHIVDTANVNAMTVVNSYAPPSGTTKFDGTLAVYRGRVLAGAYTTGIAKIGIWYMSTPTSPTLINPSWPLDVASGDLPAGTSRILGLGMAGPNVFYAYQAGTKYGLGITRLGPDWDGAPATLLHDIPITDGTPGNLIIAGDLLYLRKDRSVAVYDLKPFFDTGAAPVLVGGQIIPEPPFFALAGFQLDGLFLYMVGDGFRLFDLR